MPPGCIALLRQDFDAVDEPIFGLGIGLRKKAANIVGIGNSAATDGGIDTRIPGLSLPFVSLIDLRVPRGAASLGVRYP